MVIQEIQAQYYFLIIAEKLPYYECFFVGSEMSLRVLMFVVLLSVVNGRSTKSSLLSKFDIGCHIVCEQRYLSCMSQFKVWVWKGY